MDLRQVVGLAAWPEHRRLLDRAVARFHKDARVPGLLLGGSFVSGNPDFYSDLDLYIVVDDRYFLDVLAEKKPAASAAGRVLTGFVSDHLGPGGDEMYIAVYDGPVEIDFNYLRRSTLKPSWKMASRFILKDADGSVGEVIRSSAGLTPPPPSREALEVLHNKFWSWCWYVFGKIARGELWEALGGVHDIRERALVPLLEWDAGRPSEGAPRLESRVSDQSLARLAATVSPPDAAALYRALTVEIEMFRELQARVYPRYQVTVDDRGSRDIQHAIESAWQTRGQ
jgi:predicted nucleotidyltransferase